jgi:hypothetical protein
VPVMNQYMTPQSTSPSGQQPSSNATLTQPSSASTSISAQQHKRVYQACIPCRRRKVRCDLGSVDDPHDPPCVRCRRESKECYFSATRRKRKDGEDDEDEGGDEAYVVRNGRKRHQSGASPTPSVVRTSYSNVPLTPGGSAGRTQPLRPPNLDREDRKNSEGTSFADISEPNAQLENLEAQSVMRRGVYGPHDALDLLYKAANFDRLVVPLQPGSDAAAAAAAAVAVAAKQGADCSSSPRVQSHPRREETGPTGQPLASVPGRKSDAVLDGHPSGRLDSRSAEPIDPRLMTSLDSERQAIEKRTDLSGEPGYKEALRAWSRFRFVRAGWFTKEEAIRYIA